MSETVMLAIIGLVVILLAALGYASVKYTTEVLSGEEHEDEHHGQTAH